MNRTAVLIIHGIGEQEPFETLDAFARPFSRALEQALNNRTVRKKHELVPIKDWIDSRIILDAEGLSGIDLYEYYWAHQTQRVITAGEVVSWLTSVARGAKKYYRRSPDKSLHQRNHLLFTRDGEFKSVPFLANLFSLIGWGRFLTGILCRVGWTVPGLLQAIGEKAGKPLVDTLGDVAVYTNTDCKSQYFSVRQAVLSGCVEKLTALMQNDAYDRIILAGHSLGSVIAYDTLDRLNKRMNVDAAFAAVAQKITGLVTFGSPLDKIAFFFDEKIDPGKQGIRYAITSQLHSFKRKYVAAQTVENGVRHYFDHVRWINFWTMPDPVCGHLDVYRDVENIEMNFAGQLKSPRFFRQNLSLASHSLYWESPLMYQHIIQKFHIV